MLHAPQAFPSLVILGAGSDVTGKPNFRPPANQSAEHGITPAEEISLEPRSLGFSCVFCRPLCEGPYQISHISSALKGLPLAGGKCDEIPEVLDRVIGFIDSL